MRARAILAALLALAGPVAPAAGQTRPSVAPAQILVLGRPAPPAGVLAPLSQPDALGLPEIARRRGVPVTRVRALAAGPAAREAFPGGAWTVELEPSADPIEAARRLAADPSVLYAGPNHLLVLEAGSTGDKTPLLVPANVAPPEAVPDDPLFEFQDGLTLARIPEAWESALGDGILVAVIDTGVETGHPDLANRIAINDAERDGFSGVDDDSNGYVDDVVGYDFTDAPGLPGAGDYLDRDPDPADDHGHGTQVAGVIAAERGNGIGIAGVAPGARILAVRAGFRTSVVSLSGLLQEDDVAAAVLYAVDRGANILNFSFGETADAPILRLAVRFARARGVLVVASAGNSGGDEPHFPGGYPGVLAVGAINREDFRAPFSTFGQDLDLLAPGVSILTTSLSGDYRSVTGTSFSSPMAAGVAALVWSLHPGWNADEIAWAIRLSARRTVPGWTPDSGWGRLDASAAVATARPPVLQVEEVEDGDGGLDVRGTVSDPGLVSWTLAVAPDSVAVAGEAPGPIPGERVLVENETRQRVGEALAAFFPDPGDGGYWVARLAAIARGRSPLEERSRFLVTPGLTAREVTLEAQAGDAGWDLVATWTSEEPNQGSAVFAPGASFERTAEEISIVRGHALRLAAPLPAGSRQVRILGRGNEAASYTGLLDTTAAIPAALQLLRGAPFDLLPAGTPMGRMVDWDEDGIPEVLVEVPPTHDIYGEVQRFEIEPTGEAVPAGSGGGLYHGIPWDSADADGDGRRELLVFRTDGWGIWEAAVPGGFPIVQIFAQPAGTSLPLGFAVVEGETVLLTVTGSTLRAFRLDPSLGYMSAGEATAPGPGDLRARGAWGDFDGDGRLEVALADETGKLVVFEVTATGVAWQSTDVGPAPLTSSMLALPREDGLGDDLLALEQDPATFETGADIYRASIRARRLRWADGSPSTLDALAFAGFSPARDLGLLQGEDGVLLRRRGRCDLLLTAGDALAWGGRVWTSDLATVDGGVWIDPPGPAPGFLWIGTSSTTSLPGEEVSLAGSDPGAVGGALYAAETTPVAGGIRVLLAWGPDGCGEPVSLDRNGSLRGSYSLTQSGTAAEDTVGLGETVTYFLAAPTCAARALTLTGRAIPLLLPHWEGAEVLALDLDAPLVVSPLPEVRLVKGATLLPPRAMEIDREGRRLVVSSPVADPDSLVVMGGRYRDGLPLGGARRAAFAVPAPPVPRRELILARVAYRRDASGPALAVSLGGDLPTCPVRFRLDPGGAELDLPPGASSEILLPLASPLAAGTYTLRALGDCLPTDPVPLGSERVFAVGVLLYPNPVRPGEDLTLENLEPGTSARLLDVSGRERAAWRVGALLDRRNLGALAPGLYFLRLEGPDGRVLGVKKLAVLH